MWKFYSKLSRSTFLSPSVTKVLRLRLHTNLYVGSLVVSAFGRATKLTALTVQGNQESRTRKYQKSQAKN